MYDGVLPHPFALTVFEDTVYWTDWNTRTVEKGNKYDGSGREALVNTTHRPFDIHVCHPYRQPIGESRSPKQASSCPELPPLPGKSLLSHLDSYHLIKRTLPACLAR